MKKEEQNLARRIKHAQNPVISNNRATEWREANPTARKTYYWANKEREQAQQQLYREKHHDYWIARLKRFREENQNYHASYNKEHRAEQALYSYMKRRAVAQATPRWVDTQTLVDVYRNCPVGYHVDHIHPIKNKLVCGLNVPWNMQYLTASENSSKCNKFDGTYENEGWRRQIRKRL